MKSLTWWYHLRDASSKPYTHFLNFQTYQSWLPWVVVNIYIYLSIVCPWRRAVFMSIVLRDHFFWAMITIITLRESLEKVGDSFFISFSGTSKPLATNLAFGTNPESVFLMLHTHLTGMVSWFSSDTSIYTPLSLRLFSSSSFAVEKSSVSFWKPLLYSPALEHLLLDLNQHNLVYF